MAKEVIREATPEQWAEIEKIKQKWIDQQVYQSTDEEIENACEKMWRKLDYGKPQVVVADSPIQAMTIATEKYGIDADNVKQAKMITTWRNALAGWYEGAAVLGVEFDKEIYDLFIEWNLHISFIVPFENICFVSRRPVEIHWEQARLHNDKGPAVLYKDGYSIWAINGVHFIKDGEKIVMHPETQTIDEISDEDNMEIKRLRIERYGWSRYLDAMNADKLDECENYIDSTKEVLYKTKDYCILIVACPSTAKVFALEVPLETKTCKEAQLYLSSGLADRTIASS